MHRFLTFAHDRTLFIGLSFVIRIFEAAGVAAHVTASFTLIAIEFPDNIFTVFVSFPTHQNYTNCTLYMGCGISLG